MHHEIRSSTSSQPQAYTAVAGPAPSARQQEPSASSATKELDDLMASLSDFKVKEEPGATSQVAQVVELVRHKPQQPQSGPPAHAAGLAAGGGENAGGGRTLTVRHAHTPAPTPRPPPSPRAARALPRPPRFACSWPSPRPVWLGSDHSSFLNTCNDLQLS